MAALQFRQRRVRRWWITGITVTICAFAAVVFVAASGADLPGGCDFSPANNGTPGCLGPLTGSTFAGGDGNMLASPTTFGSTDWENVTGLNTGFDLASGKPDNSFGQGTKEDDPNVTVVTGSIPPNKSDLTRFYEASEFANNSNFLYLAWERTNNLGTANFDFEINQKTQPDLTVAGPAVLNRTAGDLLVTFDFDNGGGRPSVAILRWVTSGATSQCFSANSLPCWGNRLTLDGTDSIAAVNNLDAVTDPLSPTGANYINPVPALQFGETAIDLTKAGVFPAGTCTAFGSAFVRSRSSSAFTAEIKDFIAPIPINVSNCGSVKIIKHTSPRGVNKVFSYTSNLPAEAAGTVGGVAQGGVACPGNANAGVQADGSFCLNDNGNTTGDSAGNTIYNNVLAAKTYTVTEGADPSGFQFTSVTCQGGTTSTSGRTATITLKPNDAVVCTYLNTQLTGAIKITKTSSKAAASPLAGAKFSIKDPNGNALPGSPFTTDANGVVCVDGLTSLGSYKVQETSPPTGYAIDDSTEHTVSVTGSNAKCSDTSFTGQSLSFTDTPLTDIVAKATSQVSGGTKSRVTCVNGSNANVGNSPQPSASTFADPAEVDANGLKPGTYTCTIIIDP
jgi:Prealbumin-like fold domain